jgi:succinate dehydrogenase hydrophobic anchor subunit
MFNMNNKKVKQRISAVIIVLLVIAMIVPTITSIFY